jgi:hypothetical protein
MFHQDYEIRNYHPDFKNQIINLEKLLWGENIKENTAYFDWKYEKNPYSKEIIGTVGLYKSKVIGFNGISILKWFLGDKKEFFYTIGSTGSCVHVNHRRKGLHTAMVSFIDKKYKKSKFKSMIGFSGNFASIASGLKAGWTPFAKRKYLRRYNYGEFMKREFLKIFNVKSTKIQNILGKYGRIEVTQNVNPMAMANLKEKIPMNKNLIYLYQDLSFLQWRFLNPRVKYIFYYIWNNNKLNGYIVIKYYNRTGAGKIVDYAYLDVQYFQKILELLITQRHFCLLHILDVNLDKDLAKTLYNFGFHQKDLISKLISKKRKIKKERYFLLKPLKDEKQEDYWYINNLDIRKIENWKLTEICSDDV